MKRKAFRTITVSRSSTKEQIILASLRAFHIHDDPKHYIITDFYDINEKELSDFMPVQSLSRKESKRPAIFLRFKPPNACEGFVRVHPGKLK